MARITAKSGERLKGIRSKLPLVLILRDAYFNDDTIVANYVARHAVIAVTVPMWNPASSDLVATLLPRCSLPKPLALHYSRPRKNLRETFAASRAEITTGFAAPISSGNTRSRQQFRAGN